MKSITIHNLDDELARLIRHEADKKGTSLNKTIKQLLRQALGISNDSTANAQNEFADLFGTWSGEDLKSFDAATQSFGEIDKSDWE
jgi:plasmid stability protein